MANAIKKISVQRGYDVTEYALQCFGGAGGKHACLIADVLGMKTVLINPFAGVLSAYGMGLADVTALRERSIETIFDAALESRLRCELDDWLAKVRLNLSNRILTAGALKRASMSIFAMRGQIQPLPLPLDRLANDQDFEVAYSPALVFLCRVRACCAMISVESIGRNFDVESNVTNLSNAPLEILDTVKCYMNDRFVDAPVYARDRIAAGQLIMGPALIAEPTVLM